jgi:hypothetical protein
MKFYDRIYFQSLAKGAEKSANPFDKTEKFSLLRKVIRRSTRPPMPVIAKMVFSNFFIALFNKKPQTDRL